MNNDLFPIDLVQRQSLPHLVAFCFAPLVIKTMTVRCKVRPEANDWLEHASREVNQVWNFANQTSHEALNRFVQKSLPLKKNNKLPSERQWLSSCDLGSLVAGCGGVFEKIGVDVAQKVVSEFVTRRNQFKKNKLRFRCSSGRRRSLGWVPFKGANIRQKGNSLRFMGKRIRLFNDEYYFEHRKKALKVSEGNFAQNSLGDWFLNQVMEVPFASLKPLNPTDKIGIDLGKDISMSNGEKIHYSFYRNKEEKMAVLQKRGHKKQAKRLSIKIKNKRLNQQHQDTTRLVREYGSFCIGDISVVRIKQKTAFLKMGKSVSDNSLGQFKAFLNYKGHWAGRTVVLVSEKDTTRVCSNCGLKSGPKGLKQLDVRRWHCQGCETWHDRDHNAAKNMLTQPLSIQNASFQPRKRLPFAGTRER